MCSLATLFCAEEEHDDDALLPWLLPEAADVEAEAETLGPELLELTEAGDTVRAGLAPVRVEAPLCTNKSSTEVREEVR